MVRVTLHLELHWDTMRSSMASFAGSRYCTGVTDNGSTWLHGMTKVVPTNNNFVVGYDLDQLTGLIL